jgi:hypothetical protein
MKAPASPSIGLQPDRRPGFEAGRVVPVDNPMAAQAEQLGQATEAAGQAVLRADAIMRERLARARAREADAKIADGFRELLTSPKGYRNKVGREAVDGREDTLRELDSHRKRILDTLSPEERELIADSDSARYQQVRGAVDGHYANQLEAYETAEIEARAGSLLTDSLEGYFLPKPPVPGPNDRDPYKDNRVAMQTELRTLAARKGLGENATKALLTRADDQLHSAIVDRLVGDGKATQAADYLANEAKDMTGSVKATLAKRVRDGGIKEQAQQVASWVSRNGGSFSNQLDILEAMGEKELPIEVVDEAKRRLVADAELRSDAMAAAGKAALDSAKTWASLNRGASLPEAAREKLRETGQEAAFDLWTLQGNQFVTTNAGLLASLNLSDEDLAKFSSEADVTRTFRTSLSDTHLGELVLRYRKAKGESLSTKEVETVGLGLSVKNFLDQKEFFTTFKSSNEKDLSRRIDLFTEAVAARVNELAQGKTGDRGAYRAQAMKDVYTNGAVVGGRWVPSVMMTREEAQDPNAASRPTKQGMIVTQQMMAGDAATGLAQRDPTTVRLVDGGVVDFRGSAADDVVPTRGVVTDRLRRKLGRPPTEPEIAQEWADIRSVQLERKNDAQQAATIENKLRAKAMLEGLDHEFSREFTAGVAAMDESQRLLKQAEAARKSSDRAAESDATRAAAGYAHRLSLLFGDSVRIPALTRQDVLRASAKAVLDRHRRELDGYGLSDAEAAAWIKAVADLPPTDPLRTEPAQSGGGWTAEEGGGTDARLPVQKRDPSPSAAEKAMLKALREKYAKTELPK